MHPDSLTHSLQASAETPAVVTVPGDSLQAAPLVLDVAAPSDSARLSAFLDSTACWQEGVRLSDEQQRLLQSLAAQSGTPVLQTVEAPRGIAGEPLPYQFKNDDIVTLLFLLSVFFVVWVISRSRHFLSGQLRDFFRSRPRDNMFADRAQNELRGQFFLVFQTCFVIGLLFFDYTQAYYPQIFSEVSPYQLLGANVGVCTCYFLLKIGGYAFVNNVFFSRQQQSQWNEAYLLGVLGQGLALLPVVMLVVYFDLNFVWLTSLFLLAWGTISLLLCYKCYQIFFSYPLGWVHLFLYFCTLEIAPLLVLFRTLTYANNLLLVIQ